MLTVLYSNIKRILHTVYAKKFCTLPNKKIDLYYNNYVIDFIYYSNNKY